MHTYNILSKNAQKRERGVPWTFGLYCFMQFICEGFFYNL